MKKIFNFSIFLFVIVVSLNSCNSEAKPENEKSRDYELVIKKTYELVSDSSSITWERSVKYKHINTKVKLFGTYADVSLENIEYTTEGNASAESGMLLQNADNLVSGNIVIDFSVTKFYSQAEESFFVNEEYSPATLSFTSFEKNDEGEYLYDANCELTLNETTKEIVIPVEMIIIDGENVNVVGTYVMQSIDWPILTQQEPENVVYDNINFYLDLMYKFDSEKEEKVYSE